MADFGKVQSASPNKDAIQAVLEEVAGVEATVVDTAIQVIVHEAVVV